MFSFVQSWLPSIPAGTLLHELCHCDVGPHNAAFYKLLDTLWEEVEALEDKGYTGEGDDGSGGGSGKRVCTKK